ncbi:Putative zinc-finger [Desulfonispora thiosulfatigenes DSM 11270]|uniref:Anti-sigma-W factor RsiW n=1 Tax=Desulfonispora thiosulfatigenes DSM 11270 TaxID=656914 RepID=A0A1W1V1I6_DESTI|nr:zf-HC2 domain-containing protein [Desulfonispora thiosulfatigenes]SMB87163.1 Putative zinc-finger [Desulfonispora thiosulfatigenes DSM 11270]
MHIKEELLQCYIDDELSLIERRQIEEHLKTCPMCQEKLVELKELDTLFSVSFEHPELKISEQDVNLAFKDINKEIKKEKRKGWKFKMANYKKIVSGVAATCVFGAMLFVPQVQEAVADGLHIFRVQKVENVEVNIQDLEKLGREFNSKVGEINLDQLGKLNVKEQANSEGLTLVKAQEKVPFALKYPAGFDLEQDVHVLGAMDIDFALKVEEVNKILKQLGSKDMLPEELDGKNFNVYSSGNVNMSYDVDGKWINLSQMESPQITVPQGVNVSELREILIGIPILPENIKNQLRNVRDLENTLLVPTENNGKDKVVTIGNGKGILQGDGHYSNLVWLDNGVIYSLSGHSDLDLVKVAKELRDVQ